MTPNALRALVAEVVARHDRPRGAAGECLGCMASAWMEQCHALRFARAVEPLLRVAEAAKVSSEITWTPHLPQHLRRGDSEAYYQATIELRDALVALEAPDAR